MQNMAGGSFPSSPHGQPPCPTEELLHNQAEEVDFLPDGEEGGDALLHPCPSPSLVAAVHKNAGGVEDDEDGDGRRAGMEGRAVKADTILCVENTKAIIANLVNIRQRGIVRSRVGSWDARL
jgi:hypothetical protein